MLKQIRAILLLPGIVTLVIPGIITQMTGAVNFGWSLPVPFNWLPVLLGLFFVTLGLAILIKTIHLFMQIGEGTLAPWDPTQILVVRGIYRHVRNPMISGVFCILLGEAILLGSIPLLVWFGFFVLVNIAYMPFIEEPNLERRFGEEYSRYKENVPRWIPHRNPWDIPHNRSNDEG